MTRNIPTFTLKQHDEILALLSPIDIAIYEDEVEWVEYKLITFDSAGNREWVYYLPKVLDVKIDSSGNLVMIPLSEL